MKVGEFLKDMVFYTGRSQKSMAQECKMTDTTLCDIIKGKRNISIDYANRFERVLGIPAIVWLTWQTNDEIKKMEKL